MAAYLSTMATAALMLDHIASDQIDLKVNVLKAQPTLFQKPLILLRRVKD